MVWKRARLRFTILVGAVCAALLACACAGSALAATYPGGGSGFGEGAEGWSARWRFVHSRRTALYLRSGL